MSGQIDITQNEHIRLLRTCGGYYSCPKDASGRRLAPLVGYAGKYKTVDGEERQFVGDVYANFARAEMHPFALRNFATSLLQALGEQFEMCRRYVPDRIGGFVGAPIGGYSLADAMGLLHSMQNIQVLKAEKKVTRLATAELREQSQLFFGRHDVEPGLNYVIVEDVCNNFSTTAELIKLIRSFGGVVAGIACFLNRSVSVGDVFQSDDCGPEAYPVISLVRFPIDEWKQDDPAVAEDMAKGNVVLKPKDRVEWARLMKAMQQHAQH